MCDMHLVQMFDGRLVLAIVLWNDTLLSPNWNASALFNKPQGQSHIVATELYRDAGTDLTADFLDDVRNNAVRTNSKDMQRVCIAIAHNGLLNIDAGPNYT